MDLTKHLEFFNPLDVKDSIHIIGCGAIGSNIAENLARVGIQSIHLYDFDTVSEHNITNQIFKEGDINKLKTDALEDILKSINSNINITKHNEGWQEGTQLSGYVFMCPDDIDVRRNIATENKYNPTIKAMFDCRMRLEDAQHYAADWKNNKDVENFISTMNFSNEDAEKATPVNACGTTLNILPTVRIITAYATANFINFVKNNRLSKVMIIDAFKFHITSM